MNHIPEEKRVKLVGYMLMICDDAALAQADQMIKRRMIEGKEHCVTRSGDHMREGPVFTRRMAEMVYEAQKVLYEQP